MNLGYQKQFIKDIVAKNYILASVLHFFGIEFYNFFNDPLETVCQKKGIDVTTVIKTLESCQASQDLKLFPNPNHKYEIEVIIQYLKKAHQSFIRHKLPYMADIIQNIEPAYFDNPDEAKDLKFVFPIFAEDFIKHIYEEEKYHFGYIERLNNSIQNGFNPLNLFEDLNKFSIDKIFSDHQQEDDEMKGIRELTKGYRITKNTGIFTKVVYLELKAFENDLKTHSFIENKILFPKAKKIEKKAIKLLKEKALLN
ncbi:MAG: hemerythrin domain-containing protein [Flammeovirgaceae bacterium]|nr:hemerythrin domain-containing protein [Flammeovirgaceae bacterium]